MNPFRLLTKGSTIGGLKERPGAYKLLEKSVFPNFSGPKKPVPTLPQAEPTSTQPALFRRLRPKPEKPALAKVASEPAPEPLPTPAAAPARVKDLPAKPGLWSRLPAILAGWKSQWILRRKTRPFQSPAVQTELALDKVRVIRNDLCEDDLEVVMIDKKTGNKTEKPAHCEEVESEKLAAKP
jgi:hypothetical protein